VTSLFVTDSSQLPWTPHRIYPGVAGQVLVDPVTGVDLEVRLVRVEPGAEIALHTHAASAETFYFLCGSGELVLGEETRPFQAGVCVHARAGAIHAVSNTGSSEVQLLAIFTPPLSPAPPGPAERAGAPR